MTEQAQSENTIESGVKPEPSAPIEHKTYKVKVDGAESEVSEQELISSYQKGKSADKKFQEASDLKKQLEQFVLDVKQNPEVLLEKLGHNALEWAKNRLLAEIDKEEESSDPNLRRIKQLEKKLEQLESKDSENEKSLKAKAEEAEEHRLVQALDEEISKPLIELGFTDGTAPAEIIADIAEQMLAQYKLDKSKISSKEAFGRAKTSFSNRLSAITRSKPEAILEMMPPEYLDKIAETYLSKKQGKSVPSVKSNTPAMPVSSKDDRVQKELFEFMKKK